MMVAKSIRKLVEILSRERAFVRKLPSQFLGTPLFVSPDSQLKYLKLGSEAFDPDLFRVVLEHVKERDVVWDIGANVGVFSFAAASVVGSEGYVLAVEPDIWLASLIQRSIRLRANSDLVMEILPAAVTDSTGIESFLIAIRGRASNSLAKVGGRNQMGGIRRKELVPAFTLDDLLKVSDKPNFVKIDVEGAEVSVLKGGQRVLSEARPVVYCEVGFDYREDVAKIFRAFDYKIFDGALPKASRFNQEACGFNTLAYPAESLDEVKVKNSGQHVRAKVGK